ncbi:MAG: sigma-70 family RNA polymerase sigma factor, partial [Verrucomicrobia bacterium]|nr:sigma-70 family RNA polymerase sigma factor [Verrucomicrobiota bacterium]
MAIPSRCAAPVVFPCRKNHRKCRKKAIPYFNAYATPSHRPPMPPTEQARWFAEEVQPHEPALRAYLQARFPTLADHDDLVQETYTRLLRAQANGGVRYPKAFLFTAARNAAFDLFRRRGAKPTEAVTDLVELTVLEDIPGVGEQMDQSYELEVLADAVRALPDRCRQVIMLRYLDGLAYKEIAEQLGISAETVKV